MYRHHQDLNLHTHALPTRLSSELISNGAIGCRMIPAIEAQDRGWRAAYVEQKHGAVDGDQRHHLVVPTEQRAGQKSERRCDHPCGDRPCNIRSEEHTSELQSLMRISYAVFCLKKKTQRTTN